MPKLLRSPLALSTTPSGYSIVNTIELTSLASQLVLLHICGSLGKKIDCLESAAELIIGNYFSTFKHKFARILTKDLAEQFLLYLEKYNFVDYTGGDFVTDEEGLGYANIYWRIVRKNSSSDVGPIHADRWFWRLGAATFPTSHARVKVWMPLIQDDENPSLMVLPGSHEHNFHYGYTFDESGKKKPIFNDDLIAKSMITAPVKVGEAIIFHDSLLHGGKTTDTYRVSLEFTLGERLS